MKDVKRLRPSRLRSVTKSVRRAIGNLTRSRKTTPLPVIIRFHTDRGVYEGEFNYDETDDLERSNGMGITKYNNKSMYYGQWKNGYMDGLGIYEYSNGEVYEGEWKNGRKNGVGNYKFKNGDVYEGEWKNDKKNGMGNYKFKNGDFYEGEWKDDRFIIGQMHPKKSPVYFVTENDAGHIEPIEKAETNIIRTPIPTPIAIAEAAVIRTPTDIPTPTVEATRVTLSSPGRRSRRSPGRSSPGRRSQSRSR